MSLKKAALLPNKFFAVQLRFCALGNLCWELGFGLIRLKNKIKWNKKKTVFIIKLRNKERFRENKL